VLPGKNTHESPDKQLAGRVALVTGGARGIGRNIVRVLSQAGAVVVFWDVDHKLGERTQAEFADQGLTVEFQPIDLAQSERIPELVQDVCSRHGRLNSLVNNARSGRRVPFLSETPETWASAMEVTLKSAFFLSQEAVRVMAEQEDGGQIVNVSSVAALLASHESPVYHIAKAGMLQMTRYFAAHAGEKGVRVNAVLPGFVIQDEHMERYVGVDNSDYRRTAEACHPLGRTGRSDDVAKAVLYLCSEASSFVTGQCLSVDGGLTLQDPSSLVFSLQSRFQP
jgi:NAD(P)-dependent dehydrogenase (short-subunit alcohol dehydrogenase family)